MLIKKLGLFKIGADKPVYKPLHELLKINQKFVNTEIAQKYALSLPIYPMLTKEDAGFIAKTFLATKN